uniref:Uncharacterized protein n=1 Tax=Tetranychus urticae TaxID=32264 RepID=T1KJZ3_TETUR
MVTTVKTSALLLFVSKLEALLGVLLGVLLEREAYSTGVNNQGNLIVNCNN